MTQAIERLAKPVGPFRLAGKVVQGFQRGSKELGWPTANLDPAAFEAQLDQSEEGVYAGWASVEDDNLGASSRVVHKAVLSIGWNPYYQNRQRTVEAYLVHNFGDQDFYGSTMRLLICTFIRPQADFSEGGLQALKDAITADVDFGGSLLDAPPFSDLQRDGLFVNGAAAPAKDSWCSVA